MCGIFGYKGFINKELANSCISKLVHRGPDGSGLWHSNEMTLGHRRLSILDLSDNASQPMSYAEGRYHITFNGEIYNFLELRRELENKGYHFISQSDTEVALVSFVEWGEACLEKFNGMWAFAIWDIQDKALFLARDRLGKKPLFYTTLSNGDLAFASEMKALFPLFDQVTPNKELISDPNCIFTYESTEECVIKGIKRFSAGHFGWYRNGKLTTSRWWCTLDNLMNIPPRYEEQVEQFRDLFLDACRLRMRSDVPIGTALSGGLDSSATISAMAYLGNNIESERMEKDWQHAFVAAFPGTPLDETKYANMVTDYIGINSTLINIDPLKALNNLNKYFYLFEDLYITSPIPFMLTYEAVKAHGISVTLDGHGADELFGGYSFDYLIALKDAGWNLKKSYEIAETYFDAWPKDSEQFKKLESKIQFILIYHAKQLVKKILGRDQKYKCKDINHPGWKALDNLNKQLYISTHETILPTLLRNYDRYSMANSVEIRMPFLDHRILSFAFSIPWSSKLRNGYTKSIVRDALAPYMPKEVAYRKTKIGFNSPIVNWMKGPLRNYIMDIVNSQSFRDCDFIDSVKVYKAVCDVIDNPSARFTDGERAWTLLSPYLWEQAIVRNRPLAL